MFDLFWEAYPHCKSPPRSKKALSRGLFKKITTTGHKSRIDGIPLRLKATAEEIVAAATAYADTIDKDFETSVTENRQYVPGAHVWLHQGRWEDFEAEVCKVVAIK